MLLKLCGRKSFYESIKPLLSLKHPSLENYLILFLNYLDRRSNDFYIVLKLKKMDHPTKETGGPQRGLCPTALGRPGNSFSLVERCLHVPQCPAAN